MHNGNQQVDKEVATDDQRPRNKSMELSKNNSKKVQDSIPIGGMSEEDHSHRGQKRKCSGLHVQDVVHSRVGLHAQKVHEHVHDILRQCMVCRTAHT